MPRIRAENIEAHKRLTRTQILEAASDLFFTQGYTDTSLGDIAAEIGVGRTTVYEYFKDKEEILIQLVEDTIPALVAEMVEGLPRGLSCQERLSELIVRNLEFVADEHNVGTLIMREGPRLSGAAQRVIGRAHGRLEQEVDAICREAVASGEFRDIDPVWAGRIVNSMMMGASRTLLRDADAKQRIHEVAETLLPVLFNGLAQK